MTLRILHVLDHSVPLHSGYSFRTLAILREQAALGWQTLQLTSPKQGPSQVLQEEVDGLLFYRTPSAPGSGLLRQMQQTARRLGELVQQTRPHLIHAHSPVLTALPGLWVARRQGLPLVYEMRASWEDAAVDHGSTTEGSLRYRASRAVESFVLRHASQVTTICEGLRRDILQRGVASQCVTVVPNGVDAHSFAFDPVPDVALRQALGLEGALVLGFVGSFYRYEGLHLLLDAVHRMRLRHPQLRLLLVGGGPQEATLRAQAAALGLQDRVVFAGRVPHCDVQRYYGLIDVLAYPRLPMRLTDLVTPLKPLEAMAQGKLFVASDVGGHRELLRPDDSASLFRAGHVGALEQALEDLLLQRAHWPHMRQRARRYVETERSWSANVARYRAVYQRALQRHADTGSIPI
jgi:PEP-CTERM/exosortase A-associated glycosyltransferase